MSGWEICIPDENPLSPQLTSYQYRDHSERAAGDYDLRSTALDKSTVQTLATSTAGLQCD
jgi:hypothetical protein